MQQAATYKIQIIRDFVPEKIKPWILMVFLFIFQCSGGVYMASVTQMSGSLSLMHEDIMMAGFASLVGLCFTFTIMYRLKFCFTIKTGLLSSAIGLIICNVICLYTSSVPLLVAASFVAGIFRMWGTFMCNTTLAPWLFPKWSMPKFQSFVQSVVMGFMLISGLTAIYFSYYFQWQYMHWFILGTLLFLVLVTLVAFSYFRPSKKLPLFGIDWMGAILICTTALCVIFILIYGHHYDWYESEYIWVGSILGLSAFGLNLWRASFVRHPFVENSTWKLRSVWFIMFLYIVINILVNPSTYIEQMYTAAILNYDDLNRISLNWVSLAGYVCAALFTYQTLALRKWKFKTMTVIAFSLLVGYLLIMYFLIDYNLPKTALVLPVFMRSAAMLIFSITFLSALFQTTPFPKFFQALNIVTLVGSCIGSLLASAVLTRGLEIIMKANELFFGASLDNVNILTSQISADVLYWKLHQHAMLVAMKEIYGWLTIAGVICILAFLLRESSLRPRAIYPKYFSHIKRIVKHQLKMDRIIKEV